MLKVKLGKYLAITLCGVILYLIAHEYSTLERGYEAIGGEALLLLLPLWWGLLEQTAKDMWDMFRGTKDSEL